MTSQIKVMSNSKKKLIDSVSQFDASIISVQIWISFWNSCDMLPKNGHYRFFLGGYVLEIRELLYRFVDIRFLGHLKPQGLKGRGFVVLTLMLTAPFCSRGFGVG